MSPVPNRSGPAEQAVSVKRMEPSAQAQPGSPGLDPSLRGDAMGLFTLPWVVVVFVLWPGSFRIHLALLSTFTCVLVVFVGLVCNGFTGEVIWNRIAGWAGLCAALGATCLLAGQILASAWGRPVLPMGRFLSPQEHPET
ncbi:MULTISPECIES: GPR1/FUN34/YaaH family transporter [unclassified Streptomyces]|uniref:GPR1/FUN34/YaaH family transporter n=1 Tax=unclassified Streptomyces TaxID=2593676 RepID=UPI00381AB232